MVAQAPPDGHTLLFGASFYSEVLALAQNTGCLTIRSGISRPFHS